MLWMRMRASIANDLWLSFEVLLVYCHQPTARDSMVKSAIKGVDGTPSLMFDMLDQQANQRIGCGLQIKAWQAELCIPCHQEGISLCRLQDSMEDGLFEAIAQGTAIRGFIDKG